jgi:hypothetical protein
MMILTYIIAHFLEKICATIAAERIFTYTIKFQNYSVKLNWIEQIWTGQAVRKKDRTLDMRCIIFEPNCTKIVLYRLLFLLHTSIPTAAAVPNMRYLGRWLELLFKILFIWNIFFIFLKLFLTLTLQNNLKIPKKY